MGTVGGAQAREARPASLTLPPLWQGKEGLCYSALWILHPFWAWELNPMSDSGVKLDPAEKVKIPWLPSCYLTVRVWGL